MDWKVTGLGIALLVSAVAPLACRTSAETALKDDDSAGIASLPDALPPMRFDQAWSMFNHPLTLRIPEARRVALQSIRALVPAATDGQMAMSFAERFALAGGIFIDWTGLDLSVPFPNAPDQRSIKATYMIRAGLPNSVELTEDGNLLSPDLIMVMKDGTTEGQTNALAREIRRAFPKLVVLPLTAVGVIAVTPMKHVDDVDYDRRLLLDVTRTYKKYKNHPLVMASEVFSQALFHVDSIFGMPQPIAAADKIDLNRLRTNEISYAIEASLMAIRTVPALAPPLGNGPVIHPLMSASQEGWMQSQVLGQVRFGESHARCKTAFANISEVFLDIPLYGWIAANPSAEQIARLSNQSCLVDLFRLAIAPPGIKGHLIMTLTDQVEPTCRADITDNFEVVYDLPAIGVLIVSGTEEDASRLSQLPCVTSVAFEAAPVEGEPEPDPLPMAQLRRPFAAARAPDSVAIQTTGQPAQMRNGMIPRWRKAQLDVVRQSSARPTP